MIPFILLLIILITGYFIYGRFVEKIVQPDPNKKTPAYSVNDGVDYVAMPTWRVYLVQLLNIAGLGPVFGPILGALWGPVVFFWVVIGCILGGAVHDFLIGSESVRLQGAGLPTVIGKYLGNFSKHAATVLILVLLLLIGTVFVKGPAGLIVKFIPATYFTSLFGQNFVEALNVVYQGNSLWLWIVIGIVFIYYVLATLLPIDKVIGRFYPFLAIMLIIMVLGLLVAIITKKIPSVPFSLHNLNPSQVPIWPYMFIIVSCGAISGFHGTQSPLMARCIKSETNMRAVFYGAMIVEGIIALIWSYAAFGYYGGAEGLLAALGASKNPTIVVQEVCVGTMGSVGGFLAIMGVIVLPITSGDTAFRAARLILADYFKLGQQKIINRYKVALPLFAISLLLMFIPFGIIWRYFGWANQTLAAVTLWACAVALVKKNKNHWIASLPATFMTATTVTYLLVESRAHGCFGLDFQYGMIIGIIIGLICLFSFIQKFIYRNH